MPRKARQKKPEEVYTLLSIRVDSHDVCADASINHHVHYPESGLDADHDDPLFTHVTHLTIRGTSTYPDERAGDTYEVTIYGDDAPSRGIDATLKDAQERNEYGSPRYRAYRGRQIPVYRSPAGFGLMDKVRGERAWTAWVNLAPRMVSDMLILLERQRQLYLSIHERRAKRARWVYGITLQTTEPSEE